MAAAIQPQTPQSGSAISRVISKLTPSRQAPPPPTEHNDTDEDDPVLSPPKLSSDFGRGLMLPRRTDPQQPAASSPTYPASSHPSRSSPLHSRSLSQNNRVSPSREASDRIRKTSSVAVSKSSPVRKPSQSGSFRSRLSDDGEEGKKRILGIGWNRSKDNLRRSSSREGSVDPSALAVNESRPRSPPHENRSATSSHLSGGESADHLPIYSSAQLGPQGVHASTKATPGFPRPGLSTGLSESSKRFRSAFRRTGVREGSASTRRAGRALRTDEPGNSSSPSDNDNTPESGEPYSGRGTVKKLSMSMDHLQLVTNEPARPAISSTSGAYNARPPPSAQRLSNDLNRPDSDPIPHLEIPQKFQRASSESMVSYQKEYGARSQGDSSSSNMEQAPEIGRSQTHDPDPSPPLHGSLSKSESRRLLAREDAQSRLEAADHRPPARDRTPSPQSGYRQSNSPAETVKVSKPSQPSSIAFPPVSRPVLAERNPNGLNDYRVPLKRLSSSPLGSQVSNANKENARHEPPPSQQPLPTNPPDSSNQAMKSSAPKMAYVTINGKQYAKGRKLGRGGSSTVYQISDKAGFQYALKKVELRSHDHESYRSFINEIALLERLRGQERIIQLFESEVNEPKKMLLMIIELGEIDLSTLLQERCGKRVSINFVRYTWEQMLEAVNVIHEAGIVHTDLKPANFVLVKGSLKLIDFGIGQVIPDETANIQRDTQIGTANYMPPEALRPEFQGSQGSYKMKLGRPADVWSLGCILYQMAYGITPFGHMRNLQQKMSAIQNEKFQISFPTHTIPKTREGEELSELATRVEDDLINVLKACLQFNRSRRPTIPELYNDRFLRHGN